MPVDYYIGDVESVECPRSRSAFGSGPFIEQVVTESHKAGWVKEGSGAFPGGGNTDDWDARSYDMFYLIEVQKSRVTTAEKDATR